MKNISFFKQISALEKDFDAQKIIENLVLYHNLCNFNKLEKWCGENNPRLIIETLDTRQEYVYDYCNGYVGEQLKMKLIGEI
jgi:hypothetical protein